MSKNKKYVGPSVEAAAKNISGLKNLIKNKKLYWTLVIFIVGGALLLQIPSVGNFVQETLGIHLYETESENSTISLSNIPAYSEEAYIAIHDNQPFFTEEDMTTISFESYADLDDLGRCGIAFSCVGQDLMPTEDRGSISSVKPTGWQSIRYDIVEGGSLYNRCHLIAFQLTGENANRSNLITGTRYLNIEGMLPFENLIADYVKETNNHVLYRVTPIFEGDNLVASGVLLEGYSVEDQGEGVCFCVYAYNVQPGIMIDYSDGNSTLAD